MTALDIIVIILLAGGAILGFRRGFVQEVLSLFAWMAVIIVIRIGHGAATQYLVEPVGSESGASVLALVLLFAITYFLGKWVASSIGDRVRRSVLGPIDRVLGFGFGALKGLIIATLLFQLTVMVLALIRPGEAQPEWMRCSRTFPLLNASGDALIDYVGKTRNTAEDEGGS